MKIAIIAAMRKELDLLLDELQDCKEIRMDDLTIYEGKVGDHEIIAMQCGIGKVNSALRTQTLINMAHPDLVINSGVAGGVDASMPIGSVLVADRVAYHDVWCGPGTEYGEADGCPLFFLPDPKALDAIKETATANKAGMGFGLLCSGDKFISVPEEVEEIKSHFPEALGCDMESASIAQVCYKAGVPFMVVRVLSDRPGSGENVSEYKEFWEKAPGRTFEAVSSMIKLL